MHACSTSSCLPAEIVVDCIYVFTVEASPPDVEMVRLVALRYGGESSSISGCLCDGTGALYASSLITIMSPLQFGCSGKAPVWKDVYLSMSIALGKK